MQGWFTKKGTLSKMGRWQGDVEVQRNAIRFLVEHVMKLDDVTKLHQYDFASNRLGGLLERYFNSSPYAAVSFAFPELHIQQWEMETVPMGYWTAKEHRNAAIMRLGQKLGKNPERLSAQNFKDNGLGTLLSFPLYELIKDTSSVLGIKPWELSKVPINFWSDSEHVKEAMLWLEARTGKAPLELIGPDFISNSLYGLLQAFDGKTSAVLASAHPDLRLNPIIVAKVPDGYWSSLDNLREAVGSLVKETGKPSHMLTEKDYRTHKLGRLLARYGNSPLKIAKMLDPDLEVDPTVVRVPRGYWNSIANRQVAVIELLRKTGKKPAEIKEPDFNRYGLGSLIRLAERKQWTKTFLRKLEDTQAEEVKPKTS
ncbi:MAG: hypothetical protein BK997_00340 [Candidatus Micrarchaeum sp. ARMAN-1]|nr:MAG: hypothetical protein BK997_00340 [Candidatus Micrarchaeum sp. ARMAN-1]